MADGLFMLTEYSAWIAMLVFVYGHGGAAIAGLVALAQVVCAALLAGVRGARRPARYYSTAFH